MRIRLGTKGVEAMNASCCGSTATDPQGARNAGSLRIRKVPSSGIAEEAGAVTISRSNGKCLI